MISTRALIVCVSIGAVAAQAQVQTRPLCFRGQPLPACRTFLLFELGELGQASTAAGILPGIPSNREDPNWYGSIDVGAMVNRSDRTAVGGTAEVGVGQGDRRRLALELRRRQWLSDRTAVDLGAGPLELNGRNSFVPLQPGATYGATAHAGLVFMDLATATAATDFAYRGHPQVTVLFGGRFGSYAGVAATLVVAIGVGAVIALGPRD
jgi:hypothetical protein